nr:hypothetical protein [Tanacetum cinerariifolium]
MVLWYGIARQSVSEMLGERLGQFKRAMAGRVRGNQIARRVIDDLIDFKLEAFKDPGEVYDTFMCLRDDRRAEETKLANLNDLITQTAEEIKAKNTHMEMRENERNDGWLRSVVAEVGACIAPYVKLYGYASWLVLARVIDSPSNLSNVYAFIASTPSFLGVRIALSLDMHRWLIFLVFYLGWQFTVIDGKNPLIKILFSSIKFAVSITLIDPHAPFLPAGSSKDAIPGEKE